MTERRLTDHDFRPRRPRYDADASREAQELEDHMALLDAAEYPNRPECQCRTWAHCPGATGPDFQGPCPGPPEPIIVSVFGL